MICLLQGVGIFQGIRNRISAAAAVVTSPFTRPEMVPYTLDRNVTAEDGEVRSLTAPFTRPETVPYTELTTDAKLYREQVILMSKTKASEGHFPNIE